MLAPRKWVCSSAWLERTPDKGEVGSSTLPRPTRLPPNQRFTNRGHSSAGRAPALQAGGRRFDPAWLHQVINDSDLGHYRLFPDEVGSADAL